MAKTKENDKDNLEIIQQEILKFGETKSAKNSIMVVCPFHEDTAPSMGIYIGVDDKIPLGFYNCLGCGAKGTWNELAAHVGLQPIKTWHKSSRIKPTYYVSKDMEEQLLGEAGTSLKTLFKRMGCPEAQKWPEALEWRGFEGKLIHKVQGYIIHDAYNDSVAVVFPIEIAGQIRGGVKAIYERKSKKQLAYVTSKGEWIKSYGLFPYKYTERLIKRHKYDFVILVEGPRDALRLLAEDIPALAILGANAFDGRKSLFVAALGVDYIYVMPDNDKGGTKMWKVIKTCILKDQLGIVTRIDLPKSKKKIDPGNMSRRVLKRLQNYLESKHSYEAPGG